ncbi:MAG: HEAT repeat domain-containing protein [Planctomycetota bacterium]|jgi:hypothetical protein
MLTKRSALVVATIATLAATSYVIADASKAELGQAFGSNDSHVRHETFKKIDGDNKKNLKILYKILEAKGSKYGNWYDREAAIDVLARASNEDVLADMKKKLEGSKGSYLLRQGLCKAFAKMGNEDVLSSVFEALNDKDPRVRREAAYWLKLNPKKPVISALITRWLEEEEDPVVITFIRSSLEEMTKRYLGPVPEDWANWWKGNQDDFVVGSDDEEAAKEAEDSGKKMKGGSTVARDVTVDFVERGIGKPVLVIPPYGYSKEVITPFMTVLEQSNKLFYIDMPPIDQFKSAPAVAGIKYYPLDSLVEAFEAIRKDRKVKRFAIMAWGFSSSRT